MPVRPCLNLHLECVLMEHYIHRHFHQGASPIIVDTSSVQAAGAKLDFSVRPIFPDDDPSTDQHFSTVLAATTPYWQ